MILVKPSFTMLDAPSGEDVLRSVERAGRTCYKSEDRIVDDSAAKFVRGILARGHESVIEHASVSVRFTIDRGVSHELVRHRLCAFSQESTRYCNYKGGVTFVVPPWVDVEPGTYSKTWTLDDGEDGATVIWFEAVQAAERNYRKLLYLGSTPQQARSVLPNSLKTEIIVTANMREWRHILRLRTSRAAHPQMREIMVPLLQSFHCSFPVLFDDITTEE